MADRSRGVWVGRGALTGPLGRSLLGVSGRPWYRAGRPDRVPTPKRRSSRRRRGGAAVGEPRRDLRLNRGLGFPSSSGSRRRWVSVCFWTRAGDPGHDKRSAGARRLAPSLRTRRHVAQPPVRLSRPPQVARGLVSTKVRGSSTSRRHWSRGLEEFSVKPPTPRYSWRGQEISPDVDVRSGRTGIKG